MKILNKLLEEPNHINPYLTHWTGRNSNEKKAFSILENIVSNKELKFGECTTSYPKSIVKIRDTMICFTDTPIDHSLKHCERYKRVGISFNKEKLIQYGANPVLYIVENRKEHQEYLGDLKVTNMFPYKNNKERNYFVWFLSIMQPYKTVGLKKLNSPQYLEREWRIVRVLPTKLAKASVLGGGDYLEPYSSTIRPKEVTIKGEIKEVCFLKFDPRIIENIIVPFSLKEEAITLMNKNNLDCDLIVINNEIKY